MKFIKFLILFLFFNIFYHTAPIGRAFKEKTKSLIDNYKKKSFLKALEKTKNIEELQKLIKQNEFDLKDLDLSRVLFGATLEGQYQKVKFLANNGANINLKLKFAEFFPGDKTPLELFLWGFNDLDSLQMIPVNDERIIACHNVMQTLIKKDPQNCLKMFYTFLVLGAELDQTVMGNLMQIYCNETLLKTYVEYFSDLQKTCSLIPIPAACANIVLEYVTMSPETMELMKFAQKDDIEKAIKIIKRKNEFKLSVQDYTSGIPSFNKGKIPFSSVMLQIAMQDAIKTENYELINDILKQEIDIDAPVRNNGTNCLAVAILNNNIEMVKFLLLKGANPNYKVNNEDYLLMLSSFKNVDIEIMRELIKSKANINAKSKNGITALSFSTHEGCLEKVKLLVDSKADITIKVDAGLTALDIAKQYQKHEIIRYLQNLTNKENKKSEDLQTF